MLTLTFSTITHSFHQQTMVNKTAGTLAITTLRRKNCIGLLKTLLYQRSVIIVWRIANCFITLQQLLYLMLRNAREGLEYCWR